MIKDDANKQEKLIKKIYLFAGLLNFKAECDDFQLSKDTKISLATKKEKATIKKFKQFEIYPTRLFVVSTVKGFDEPSIPDSWDLFRVCEALRLLKSETIGLGPQFSLEIPQDIGELEGNGDDVFIDNVPYFMKNDDIPLLRKIFDKLNRLEDGKNRQVNTAIFHMGFSYEHGFAYSPIDLMTAFESLYLSDVVELKYKLAIRASFLLGQSEKEREFYFTVLMKMYDVRSKLVHGSKPKMEIKVGTEKLTLEQLILICREILGKSILAFMNLDQKYTHKKLTEELLDQNVIESGKLLAPCLAEIF